MRSRGPAVRLDHLLRAAGIVLALAAAPGCAADDGGQAVGASATAAPDGPEAGDPTSTDVASTEPTTSVPATTDAAPSLDPTSGTVARPTFVPDQVSFQREGDETNVPETSTYVIRYGGETRTFLEVATYHGDMSWVPDLPDAVATKVGDLDATFVITYAESPDEGLRQLAWHPDIDTYVRVTSMGPISEGDLHRVAESIQFEEAT